MCLGVKDLNSMSLCVFSADQLTGCTCVAADWLGGDKWKLQLQVDVFSQPSVLGKRGFFFFHFVFLFSLEADFCFSPIVAGING